MQPLSARLREENLACFQGSHFDHGYTPALFKLRPHVEAAFYSGRQPLEPRENRVKISDVLAALSQRLANLLKNFEHERKPLVLDGDLSVQVG